MGYRQKWVLSFFSVFRGEGGSDLGTGMILVYQF